MCNELLLSIKVILSKNGLSMPGDEIVNRMREEGYSSFDLKKLNQIVNHHGDIFARSASKGIVTLEKRAKVPARASVR